MVWLLLPAFGRIGAEALFVCLGIGADGLDGVGGDGRVIGVLGGFLVVAGV